MNHWKINTQEEEWSRGLISFLAPLTKVGLPLMKNILPPLAKNVCRTIKINGSSVSNRRSYSKGNI